MFGIGLPELLVVLAVALIVLGPKRIPEAARSLGRGLAELRRATGGIAEEFRDAQTMLEEEYRKVDADARRAGAPTDNTRTSAKGKERASATATPDATEPRKRGSAQTDE